MNKHILTDQSIYEKRNLSSTLATAGFRCKKCRCYFYRRLHEIEGIDRGIYLNNRTANYDFNLILKEKWKRCDVSDGEYKMRELLK